MSKARELIRLVEGSTDRLKDLIFSKDSPYYPLFSMLRDHHKKDNWSTPLRTVQDYVDTLKIEIDDYPDSSIPDNWIDAAREVLKKLK